MFTFILSTTAFTALLALFSTLNLQVKAIEYFKFNRFIFYYADTVCRAFQEFGNIDIAYQYTDLTLDARHPDIFYRYANDDQFKRRAHKKIRRICSNRNLIDKGRIPPKNRK